jgi:hypothetical protein
MAVASVVSVVSEAEDDAEVWDVATEEEAAADDSEVSEMTADSVTSGSDVSVWSGRMEDSTVVSIG